MSTSNTPWPPPPDIDSIQELVALADPENFIAEGAPPDEYETEAELIFVTVENLATPSLTVGNILPLIEDVWQKSFELDDDALQKRRPALGALAAQIARFFGPEAEPETRNGARNPNSAPLI